LYQQVQAALTPNVIVYQQVQAALTPNVIVYQQVQAALTPNCDCVPSDTSSSATLWSASVPLFHCVHFISDT